MIASHVRFPPSGGMAPGEGHRGRPRRRDRWTSEEDRMRLVAALLVLGSLLVWILFLQG
jgi:hypothetical protein